jgi:hypothetical protein
MKKILFFAMIFSFTATVSAQSLPSAKSVKQVSQKVVAKEKLSKSDQIRKALMKDEELQAAALGHLKSNPDTAKEVASIATENKGGLAGIMKSVLGDKKLSAMAIEYIANNPKLLEKAMKIIGM